MKPCWTRFLSARKGGDAPAGADQDGLALELLEAVVAGALVGDQHLRVLLEDSADAVERQVLLGVVQGLEPARHDHVDPAAHKELRVVDLWPAHAQIAVDAVLFVEAGRDRLIEAAMLGLGAPVGLVAHLVQDLGAGGATWKFDQYRACRSPGEPQGSAAGQAISRHGHDGPPIRFRGQNAIAVPPRQGPAYFSRRGPGLRLDSG